MVTKTMSSNGPDNSEGDLPWVNLGAVSNDNLSPDESALAERSVESVQEKDSESTSLTKNGSSDDIESVEKTNKDASSKATRKCDPKKWAAGLLLPVAAWWLKKMCQSPSVQASGEVQEEQDWIGLIESNDVYVLSCVVVAALLIVTVFQKFSKLSRQIREHNDKITVQAKEIELQNDRISVLSKEAEGQANRITVQTKETEQQNDRISVLSKEAEGQANKITVQAKKIEQQNDQITALGKEAEIQANKITVQSKEIKALSKEAESQAKKITVQSKEIKALSKEAESQTNKITVQAKEIKEQTNDQISVLSKEAEGQANKIKQQNDQITALIKTNDMILKSMIKLLWKDSKSSASIKFDKTYEFLRSEESSLTSETFSCAGLSWFLVLTKRINLAGKRDLDVDLCCASADFLDALDEWSASVKFELKLLKKEPLFEIRSN